MAVAVALGGAARSALFYGTPGLNFEHRGMAFYQEVFSSNWNIENYIYLIVART